MSTHSSIHSGPTAIREQVHNMETTLDRVIMESRNTSMRGNPTSVGGANPQQQEVDDLVSNAFSWAEDELKGELAQLLTTDMNATPAELLIFSQQGWNNPKAIAEIHSIGIDELLESFLNTEYTNPATVPAIVKALILGTYIMEHRLPIPNLPDDVTMEQLKEDADMYQRHLSMDDGEASDDFFRSINQRALKRVGRRVRRTTRNEISEYVQKVRAELRERNPPTMEQDRNEEQNTEAGSNVSIRPTTVQDKQPELINMVDNDVIHETTPRVTRMSDTGRLVPEVPNQNVDNSNDVNTPAFTPARRPAVMLADQRTPVSNITSQHSNFNRHRGRTQSHRKGEMSPSAFAFVDRIPIRTCDEDKNPPDSDQHPQQGDSKESNNVGVQQAVNEEVPQQQSAGATALDTNNLQMFPALTTDHTSQEGSTHPKLTQAQKESLKFLRNATKPNHDKFVRRPILPKEVKWDGNLEKFTDFKDSITGHYMQAGAGYLFERTFQESYKEEGHDCYLNFLDDVQSGLQVKKDIQSLFGALKASCKNGVASVILMKYKMTQDGLRAWMEMDEQYDADGDKDTRIMRLEDKLSTPYSTSYRGGLTQWITDYESAMAEMTILGSQAYIDEGSKKRKIVSMLNKDPDFRWLTLHARNITYSEVVKGLRQMSIQQDRHAEGVSRMRARRAELYPLRPYANNPSAQASRASAVLHDAHRTDESGYAKALINSLSSVTPDIWEQLPPDIKRLISDARRRQNRGQGQDYRPRFNPRPGSTMPGDVNTPSSPPPPAEKEKKPPSAMKPPSRQDMGRQYSANHMTAEEYDESTANVRTVHMDPQSYTNDDDLNRNEEPAMTDYDSSPEGPYDIDPDHLIHFQNEDLDYIGDDDDLPYHPDSFVTHSNHLSIYDVARTCCSIHLQDESHHVAIMDSGADTCVIGQGWEVLTEHPLRQAKVVGFDPSITSKRALPIVSAITAVDIPDGKCVLLRIHEAVHNSTAKHTLLSTFQLGERCHSVQAIPHRHGGLQSFYPSPTVQVPLTLKGCMMVFHHRVPTADELDKYEPIDITCDTPWNPRAHTDDPGKSFNEDAWKAYKGQSPTDVPLTRTKDDDAVDLKEQPNVHVPKDPDPSPRPSTPPAVLPSVVDEVEFPSLVSEVEGNIYSAGVVKESSAYVQDSPGVYVPPDPDPSPGNFEDSSLASQTLGEADDDGNVPSLVSEVKGHAFSAGILSNPLDPVQVPSDVSPDSGEHILTPHLHKAVPSTLDYDRLSPYFLYRPRDVIRRTLLNTTQLASAILHQPLRQHVRSRFLMLRRRRLNEVVAFDTYFAATKSIEGFWCAQVFFGCSSKLLHTVGMRTESEVPRAYQDFLREHGIPHTLKRDNAKSQQSHQIHEINRKYCVADSYTEPHHPQQNAAELNGVKFLKSHARVLMDRTGTPDNLWYSVHAYICEVYNCTANSHLGWSTPYQRSRGDTPDISHLLQFQWYEPILYLDPTVKFPASQEQPGRFIGFAPSVGDALTFKILKGDMKTIIYRSVVRSAKVKKFPNLRVVRFQDGTAENTKTEPVSARTRAQDKGGDPPQLESFGILNTTVKPSVGFTSTVPLRFWKPETKWNNRHAIGPISEAINEFYDQSLHKMISADWDRLMNTREIESQQAMESMSMEPIDPDWDLKEITGHATNQEGNIMLRCRWHDLNRSMTWVNQSAVAFHDPQKVQGYWYDNMGGQKSIVNTIATANGIVTTKAKPKKKKTVTEKFGVKLPRSVKDALRLDHEQGNTLWHEAIQKEVNQLLKMGTFKILSAGEKAPAGYTYVPYHVVFDVKFDQSRKARLVAGGNWTDVGQDDVRSDVCSSDTIRMGFFLGELLQLLCCTGDVGNAFLYGKTRELIYTIAGPEFGSELRGRTLLIVMGLYGLKTSAARFHEHLADVLRTMGFIASKGDSDFWFRDRGDHYEYCACYVDDLLVWSKDPMAVMNELKKIYTLKRVGFPEYFLGGDIETMDEHWTKEGINIALSAKTYISQAVPKFEELFGQEFKFVKTPMDELYHPEVEDSALLDEAGISKYRSVIGCLNWIITLGRFDINFATSSLSRYNMCPREGHMKAAIRILRYLKTFPKGRILIDTSRFENTDSFPKQDHELWKERYPDAVEEIPEDRPPPKGKKVKLTVYVDADHAHDVVTRRSITGIILFMNRTPVRWVCKRQATVETSTYGSELVAARIAVELIQEVRYKLRMSGIEVDGPAVMLGDNMSVVLNTSVPSSVLKKKHNAIAYHKIREAIAAGIVTFHHIPSTDNLADILTKPLSSKVTYGLTRPWIFRLPKHLREAETVVESEKEPD